MSSLSRRTRLGASGHELENRELPWIPTGISGRDLAGRAYAQAQKFGAEVMIAKGAAELVCEHNSYGLRLDGSVTIPARTVVIATGGSIPPAVARESLSVRRCGCLLQRDLYGIAALRRR